MIAKRDESDTDEEPDIITWEVDYGDQESYSGVPFTAKVRVEGIHMLLINDQEQTFYPILQLNVEKFKVMVDNGTESLKGSTDIRMMMRYYNNQLDAWEPFLERTSLELGIEQNMFAQNLTACFKTPLNLNFSEELIENLFHAYQSFEKIKLDEDANKVQKLQNSVLQSANAGRSTMVSKRRTTHRQSNAGGN